MDCGLIRRSREMKEKKEEKESTPSMREEGILRKGAARL